jgi:hypothetical protein
MRKILLLRKFEINELHETLDIYSTFYIQHFLKQIYLNFSLINFT